MTSWFNPGVGTAYVGARTLVLSGTGRVDRQLATAVDAESELDALIEDLARTATAVVASFDPADAALRLAMRGHAAASVNGRSSVNGPQSEWTVQRLLIDSQTETEVCIALDRCVLGSIGPYRLERGVAPAAAIRTSFGPLDSSIAPFGPFDALLCPTSVDRPERRTDRAIVAPTDHLLGVLVFSTGERVLLDRSVVLGRNPHPARRHARAGVAEPRLVRLGAPDVSRQHAIVHVDGHRLTIDDLGSANGTRVRSPESVTTTVVPGVPRLVTPGCVVELGSGVSFAVEHVA